MRDSVISGTGTETRPSSFRAALTRSAKFNRREHRSRSSGTCRWIRLTACRGWTTPFSRGGSPAMGASTMAMLSVLLLVLLMGVCALAQSHTYGVGRTPSAEEIRAWDISIGPTGEELPPGRGTAKDGAQVYVRRGCAGCHGKAGTGGPAPTLKGKAAEPNIDAWERGRVLPVRAPYATPV